MSNTKADYWIRAAVNASQNLEMSLRHVAERTTGTKDVPLEVEKVFEMQKLIAEFLNETREHLQYAVEYSYRAQESGGPANHQKHCSVQS